MPLRQVIEQRKKVKSKKARPPRIYKRKGVKYIRPGKNKIKVSDVNLIINNQISTRSRGGNPRGQKNYKAMQKAAKKILELEAELKNTQNELRSSEEAKKEAIRMRQIKEEALAKEEERGPLRIEHNKELQKFYDGYAERTAALQDRLEKTHEKYLTLLNRIVEVAPQLADAVAVKAIEENKESTKQSRLASAEANVEAKDIANRIVDIVDSVDSGTRAELPTRTRAIRDIKPTKYIPPKKPEQDSTDDERKKTDIPDKDAILMLPTITDTSGNGKKTGPCGMSNVQIDAAMNNEPMYLKTISADQIPDLAVMANLALDEYKQCGFIVNTDPVGVVDAEHWVAVYIDCDHENVLYYYDSFGDPPTPLIAAGLKELVHKLDIPHYLAFEYNYIVNQDINSSLCGVHCILVLTELFAGMSTELAVDHREGAAKAFKHYI